MTLRERIVRRLGRPGSSRRSAWVLGGAIAVVLIFIADGLAAIFLDRAPGRLWRALAFAGMTTVGAVQINRERLRRRDRERRAAGLCTACGYDLHATPERCPECGTSPSATPAQVS